VCEVCHEPIVDVNELSPELQDQVYRPGKEDGRKDVAITFERPGAMGENNGDEDTEILIETELEE